MQAPQRVFTGRPGPCGAAAGPTDRGQTRASLCNAGHSGGGDALHEDGRGTDAAEHNACGAGVVARAGACGDGVALHGDHDGAGIERDPRQRQHQAVLAFQALRLRPRT